jgi:hypothetical protein
MCTTLNCCAPGGPPGTCGLDCCQCTSGDWTCGDQTTCSACGG